MNIVITGATGMLGQDMQSACKANGWSVAAYASSELNITDMLQVHRVLIEHQECDFLINCAAYTKVDDAESKTEDAYSVNTEGASVLARWCAEHHVTLVHFSTDYVFDGSKTGAYVETDAVNPINKYGLSKLGGEIAIQMLLKQHYILRTQWLYGKNGPNFIKTIENLASQKPEISVVNDQWGAPTSTEEVARMTCELLEKRIPWGIYHMAADGDTTWCEYAKRIITYKNLFCSVKPIVSDAYPRPARRPQNGRLSMEKLMESGITPLHWEDALKTYLENTL